MLDDLAVSRLATMRGELRMLPGLLLWLERRAWLREDSIVIEEFPLHGRRVDLVTYTRTGVLSSFELKIGSFGRVLEQAFYNADYFDRSWVVVESHPKKENMAEAAKYGVGVLWATSSGFTLLARPKTRKNPSIARTRIVSRIVDVGGKGV